MAPEVGLEPTTLRLTAECSAIELLRSVLEREVPTRCASIVIANTDSWVKVTDEHNARASEAPTQTQNSGSGRGSKGREELRCYMP